MGARAPGTVAANRDMALLLPVGSAAAANATRRELLTPEQALAVPGGIWG